MRYFWITISAAVLHRLVTTALIWFGWIIAYMMATSYGNPYPVIGFVFMAISTLMDLPVLIFPIHENLKLGGSPKTIEWLILGSDRKILSA